MFLLLGVQSMYQKFYSARTPRDARQAVALWVVGTVLVETVVVVIAIFAAAYYWEPIKEFEILTRLKNQVIQKEISLQAVQPALQKIIDQEFEHGNINPFQKEVIESDLLLEQNYSSLEQIDDVLDQKSIDPASIVLQAAQTIADRGGFLLIIGVLLLAAAVAVVISTGMNYLLSPTTNIMRDVYQRFINPDASQRSMVIIQKVMIILLGLTAFYIATNLTSVLEMSYFAYTIYGVSITPALIAALSWKRATRQGGLASIIGGALITIFLKFAGYIWPQIMIPAGDPNGDPWGIPLIYPALTFSILSLIVVSYLTKTPSVQELKELFPEK
jgi:Na+/proline symporter